MDKNIHNYTCNGLKMDISINVNRDTNDNVYRHLVEIEKLSPSTWATTFLILHTKASLGNHTNGCFKDKGMQTQVHKNGAQFHYSIFSLQSSPPLMLHNSSIDIPSIGNEGPNQSISWHMEG